MKNLIIADINRILRKKSFLFVLLVVSLIMLGTALWDRTHFFNGFVYATHQAANLRGVGTFFIGLALFFGVYVDEFSAHSLQAVIGRGLSRGKVILAKIIDCLILTAGIYLFFFLFLLLVGFVTGAHLTGREVGILCAAALRSAFTVVCVTPLAAVVLYKTDNGSLAVFVDLILLVVLPAILTMLKGIIFFHNTHLADYYITGFADRFFADTMLGIGGAGTLITGFVIYIAAAALLSFLVFRKRELEL